MDSNSDNGDSDPSVGEDNFELCLIELGSKSHTVVGVYSSARCVLFQVFAFAL